MKVATPGRLPEAVTLAQIGITTVDMTGSLRLLSDVFGFRNAGVLPIWGPIMSIQGLPGSARGLMWWLCSQQELFQLELFAYDNPVSRRIPEGWGAADYGWGRIGVVIPHYDTALRKLAQWGISPLHSNSRRCAFRDPFTAVTWELIEGSPSGHEEGAAGHPKVLYAARCVTDLDKARWLYAELLEMEILPVDALHSAEQHALWGLPSTKFDGFVARAGDRYVEVLKYTVPTPKYRPLLVTDQGIMNVAFGGRERRTTEALIGRARAAGLKMTTPLDGGDAVGTYVVEENCEVELLNMPVTRETDFGFKPAREFLPTALEA